MRLAVRGLRLKAKSQGKEKVCGMMLSTVSPYTSFRVAFVSLAWCLTLLNPMGAISISFIVYCG